MLIYHYAWNCKYRIDNSTCAVKRNAVCLDYRING